MIESAFQGQAERESEPTGGASFNSRPINPVTDLARPVTPAPLLVGEGTTGYNDTRGRVHHSLCNLIMNLKIRYSKCI